MTTAYTSLLGLALPVTGELQGTWGDTVNNSITSLLDSAVAGTTTISTDGDVTLSTTTGAANQAREAILLFSGARTAQRTITAPAQSKIYTVINATTGGYAVKLVGSGPTTGLTIPNGATAVVAWNGSDFIEIGSGTIGNLTVNGTLTVTGATTLQSTLAVTSGATIQGLTVGRGAGAVSTNTAVGAGALGDSSQTGTNNVAIGNSVLGANTSGGANTGVGDRALASSTTATFNAALGVFAGRFITGSYNTAIGPYAYQGNSGGTTTASYNTAVGYQSAYAGTTGNGFVAVGYQSMLNNTTGSDSTAVGYQSLAANTTGGTNVAIGSRSLYSNTTASNNTAVGYQAAYTTQTTGYLTALGFAAGYSSNNANGDNYASTFLGARSGYSSTTAKDATFVGAQAGYLNTTGSSNTALGAAALYSNTTASNNTAVGYQAGYTNSTGTSLTTLGYRAGYNVTTGNYNTLIGAQTGLSLTTGTGNTFVGVNANTFCGGYITTGSKNTIIGGYDGNQGGLDIRTASNYIVLSDGDGNPRGVFDGSGNFMVGTTLPTANAKITAAGGVSLVGRGTSFALLYPDWSLYNSTSGNAFVFDNGSERARIDSSGNFLVGTTSTSPTSGLVGIVGNQAYHIVAHGAGSSSGAGYLRFDYNTSAIGSITQNGTTGVLYNITSDYRLKTVIGAVSGFSERIDALEPIEYEWKSNGERTRGFLAHKFQEVYPQSVSGEKDAVDTDGNPVYQNMQASTSEVIADLVAEIQSLRKRLAAAGIA